MKGLRDDEEVKTSEPKKPKLEVDDDLQPSKGYIRVTKQRGCVLEGGRMPAKARKSDYFVKFVLKKRLVVRVLFF